MYSILRVIIITIVLTIYFALVRKKRNKITIAIGIIIGIILYFVLAMNPIERNFIGFNSVEDVIKYQYPNFLKEDEPTYIYNEDTALVKFNGATIPYLFEKENGKWRMHRDKFITHRAIYDLGYNIAKIQSKSNDKAYIVLINAFDEKEIEKEKQKIYDSNNSKFDIAEFETMNNQCGIIFYTIIDSNIENYKLYVDGITITF